MGFCVSASLVRPDIAAADSSRLRNGRRMMEMVRAACIGPQPERKDRADPATGDFMEMVRSGCGQPAFLTEPRSRGLVLLGRPFYGRYPARPNPAARFNGLRSLDRRRMNWPCHGEPRRHRLLARTWRPAFHARSVHRPESFT